MQILKTTDWQLAITAITADLKAQLASDRQVLWLVSGGSNINAACQIMTALPAEITKYLTISLTDERYGLVGHNDSNYKQLLDAGFNKKRANFIPVLVDGLNLPDSTQRYNDIIAQCLASSFATIGLFGIGTDGHIAGILPKSPASKASSLVYGYTALPYARITVTFESIRQLTASYALVFGSQKRAMLQKLKSRDLPLSDQPAQILKHLKLSFLYNDLVGEEI